jgi:hypothetical protein
MNSRVSRCIVRIAAGAAASFAIQTLALAGDVGVSINLNTPGLYGQLTIGDMPAPELLLPRPVVAVPAAVVVGAEPLPPLYLHVPPGHEKHWARHCREYNACGRQVYFVSDRWYNEVYTPRYRDRERDHEGYRHDEDHGGYRRDEHYGHDEHESRRYEEGDRGRDHEHDHGHDHDHEHDHDQEHDHDRHD